ncbi:hypothetical protein WJX74_009205 [Apatococcus lobatus]|uniref:Secreted protein n=1 Tax=Apatococcus lobatus TaxID=904363 RepID=A0AAW1RLT4_9CHLO
MVRAGMRDLIVLIWAAFAPIRPLDKQVGHQRSRTDVQAATSAHDEDFGALTKVSLLRVPRRSDKQGIGDQDAFR